jgi:hypothetical protein
MANAVEMLSGEKNRLRLRLRSLPYSSMANAFVVSGRLGLIGHDGRRQFRRPYGHRRDKAGDE